MCGIIGIAGAKDIDERALCRARDTLAHRGPDGKGLYVDRARGVALGHRRLAILDLSEAGAQPMRSADGKLVVVFNGEIFNYIELREELRGRYRFTTQTDTEVLLAAFSVWGTSCLEKLNGQFAFALYDSERGELLCARDHFGIKPFFYALQDGAFCFASEIKGLLALGIAPRVNERAVAEYLADGLYDHSEATFFDGVFSLPPGHILRYRGGQLSVLPYWDLATRPEPPEPKNEVEAAETLRFLIRDALRLQFRSDVPVGLNLSSGLDSNALYYFAKESMGAKPHLFTSCLADEKFDECRIVEKLLSGEEFTRWHRAELRAPNLWPLARELVAIEDQPFGGMPTIAYYALYRATARHSGATVLLEGQGVDEILGGYSSYLPALHRDFVRAGRFGDIARHIRAAALREGVRAAPFTLARILFSSPSTTHDLSRERCAGVLERGFARRVEARYGERALPRPFTSHLRNAQYRDIRYTKLPRVLRFNDHISMHFSKELRVPYLDVRLAEFCFFLPDRFKLSPYLRKALLQDAMRPYLPTALWRRSKISFGAFQTEWFARYFEREVRAFVTNDANRIAAYTDRTAIDRIAGAVLSGRAENSALLWRLMNLELWLERFMYSAQ